MALLHTACFLNFLKENQEESKQQGAMQYHASTGINTSGSGPA